MSELAVAKKKSVAPSVPPSRRLSVQASEAWIGWVERLAEHCRLDVSKVVDVALADLARTRSFDERPPKRV